MAMMLIEDSRAPSPRRVRIFLAEKGIDIPRRQLDIMKLEHRTPAFAALNPLQKVPVLVLDDGSAISETMAICRYFEALKPEPALFGSGPFGIAQVEMWNRRVEFELLLPVMQAARHLVPAMAILEGRQFPDWGEANKERILRMLDFLDTELRTRPHIAGQDFSVADITALTAIDFMRVLRMPRPEHQSGLNAWHERVSARPGAKA